MPKLQQELQPHKHLLVTFDDQSGVQRQISHEMRVKTRCDSAGQGSSGKACR
jgi:hypothetical protein